MYYLIVRNLGVERCIHSGTEDTYLDGMVFSCTPNLGFPGGELVREVRIICSELPDRPLTARVYKD
jgi:hypothetical protein